MENIPFVNKARFSRKWLVPGVVVLVILLGWWWFFGRKAALLTVAGEGQVKVQPTMVKFSVSVSNVSSSATVALADNNRLARDVVSTLKNNGVQETDITSSYARVIPPSQLTGSTAYQAVNVVDVTARDVARFDNLVTAVYNTGAQSVSNILFTTENSRDLEKEAVAEAIKDAKKRAREIARASGKMLGRMRSITTVEVGEAGALSGEVSQMTGGVAMSSPSQIEIVRQASLVFELR